MITESAAHGPVTLLVPASIHLTLKMDFSIAEEIAGDIESDWDKE